jgi:hypothetical protein
MPDPRTLGHAIQEAARESKAKSASAAGGVAAAAEVILRNAPLFPGRDPNPKPAPFETWRQEVKDMAARRQPGEIGVGDTAERELGSVSKFLTWLPCGCQDRKRWMNQVYSYEGMT